MSLASTVIIKKGLHGRACKGLITSQLSLYCFRVVVVQPPGVGGGGSRPSRLSWQPHRYHLLPDVHDQKYKVLITVRLNGTETQTCYKVGKRRANTIVKVVDIINKTRSMFNVSIGYVKHTTSKATATIKRIIHKL